MKKILLPAILGLCFLAGLAHATLYPGGTINAPNVEQDSKGRLVLQTISVPAGDVSYGCITFTATGAAANGVQIIAAVAGKTIVVIGWSISTDTAGRITLHHQTGAATRSNSASNIIGGGLFGANGGERGNSGAYPGLAVNQPVCADFSAAMTGVEVVCEYYTY